MAIERVFRSFPVAVKRDDSSLTSPEIACLELYHFTDMLFHDIYKMFFNTKDLSDATIRRNAEKLLQSNDAKVFLEDRKRQMDQFLGATGIDELDGEDMLDESGNFQPHVLRKIKIIAAREALKSGNTDTKAFEKILDFLIKNSNVSTEAVMPYRVLAEQCSTCRYRIHIEENYEDVCCLCRYKLESNNTYDHKTQFLTPKEQENGD